jgi:hypothetical protein
VAGLGYALARRRLVQARRSVPVADLRARLDGSSLVARWVRLARAGRAR